MCVTARSIEQVEWEYSRQLARRRLEQEQGSREVAEELSEGETNKADAGQQQPQAGLSVARIGSEARIVSDDEDDDGKDDDRNLYIVLIRYINTNTPAGHVTRSCHTTRIFFVHSKIRFGWAAFVAAFTGWYVARTWSSAVTLTPGARSVSNIPFPL